MAATTVLAAVGLALAIGMTAKGLSDQAKAKRIMNNNPRPKLNINPEEDYNQKLAEMFAGQGLSQETKQFYMQNSERGLTSSIDAILKNGGSNNDISKSYGMFVDSEGRLAMADDQRRIENLNRLLDQNRRMSGEKDKLFQVNEYALYTDKAKEAAMLYGTGGQWISQGVQTGYGAAQTYAQDRKQNNDINDINNGTGNNKMTQTGGEYPSSSYGTNAYNFNKLTPEQQATIGSLYWRGY